MLSFYFIYAVLLNFLLKKVHMKILNGFLKHQISTLQ